MHTSHLPLRFSSAKNDTLDNIEAVLAIARRAGLTLCALRLEPQAHADEVFLEVSAHEPELLVLFLARLQNRVGLGEIAARPQFMQHAG